MEKYQSVCRFFPFTKCSWKARHERKAVCRSALFSIVVFVKHDEDEKLVIGKKFSLLRRKSAVSGCSEKVNNFSEKTFNWWKNFEKLQNCTFFILKLSLEANSDDLTIKKALFMWFSIEIRVKKKIFDVRRKKKFSSEEEKKGNFKVKWKAREFGEFRWKVIHGSRRSNINY